MRTMGSAEPTPEGLASPRRSVHAQLLLRKRTPPRECVRPAGDSAPRARDRRPRSRSPDALGETARCVRAGWRSQPHESLPLSGPHRRVTDQGRHARHQACASIGVRSRPRAHHHLARRTSRSDADTGDRRLVFGFRSAGWLTHDVDSSSKRTAGPNKGHPATRNPPDWQALHIQDQGKTPCAYQLAGILGTTFLDWAPSGYPASFRKAKPECTSS